MKAVKNKLFKKLCKKYNVIEILMAMASGQALELDGKMYIINNMGGVSEHE